MSYIKHHLTSFFSPYISTLNCIDPHSEAQLAFGSGVGLAQTTEGCQWSAAVHLGV
jgi:hypothetical protein